jgi:hypothetical protein
VIQLMLLSIIDSVKSPEIVIALNGPNPVPYPESPDELSEEVKQRVELSLETAAAQEIELIATVGRAASVMALYAERYTVVNNIEMPRVFIEDKSYETIGNAHYTKQNVLVPNGLTSVHIVTSDYHLPRALRAWQQVLGEDYQISFDATHPNFTNLQRLKWQIKETAFGLIDDYLVISSLGFGKVMPNEDQRRENHIRHRHPRSPESFWRKLGVKTLADRLS